MLNADELQSFLATKPIAVIHFDTEWNSKYRDQVRRSMSEAQAAFGDQASFAEIDCDANVALARSIPVLNVPLIAYYRDGSLIAALIGANQNIHARTERVLRGEAIGRKDGTSNG